MRKRIDMGWRLGYVLCSAIVGLILVWTLPPLSGIDESAHFVRAHQISHGNLLPVAAPLNTRAGTGACLDRSFATDIQIAQFGKFIGAGPDESSEPPSTSTPSSPPDFLPFPDLLANERKCGPPNSDRVFLDYSSFSWYAPTTYVPAALGVEVARVTGVGTLTMSRYARTAQLLAVIALVFLALTRSPKRFRPAFAVIGLLPGALGVAANVAPDAITYALTFVVVATALRNRGTSLRGARLVDAVAWSALLGLTKPTYWVFALCFVALAPTLNRPKQSRFDVRRYWPSALPVVVGGAFSAAWQASQRNRFICDVRDFGVKVDEQDQVMHMITHPWDFLWQLVISIRDRAPEWVRSLVGFDDAATGTWPMAVVLLLTIGFVAIGIRTSQVYNRIPELVPYDIANTDQDDESPLTPQQRWRMAGVAALAVIMLHAGFAVYCSPPKSLFTAFFSARFIIAILPVLLIALTPATESQLNRVLRKFPPALFLVPMCVGFIFVMRHTVQ